MIISGRHKCPVCGRAWTMPVNTSAPDWRERQKAMKDGAVHLPTVCDACRGKV